MKQLIPSIMLAFLVPTPAMAKSSACKEDKAKFCKNAMASGRKVRDCLKQHAAELSPACKESLDKPKEAEPGKEKETKQGSKPSESGKPADTSKPADTLPPTDATKVRQRPNPNRGRLRRAARVPARRDSA